MNGLHLLADLYRCRARQLLEDREALERECADACIEAGLTPLAAHFVQFHNDDGSKAGVTGMVVLAESHLAIHTWPEAGDATLDVYVCNYSRDNRERARMAFDRMTAALAAEEEVRHELVRGRPSREA